MKVSRDEELARRFFRLNTCVTVILLLAIVVSVFQFGAETWKGQRQIGLVLAGGKNDVGWNRAQYRGMQEACDALGYGLLAEEHVRDDEESCQRAVKDLVEKRARVIFMTNVSSRDAMTDVMRRYPNIQFYGVEEAPMASEFQRYAVRYIEPFYLAGVLAGLRTKTGRLGYVAPHPSPEFDQAVNAFVLGAQRVNPEVQILLHWSGGWENHAGEEQAVRDFKAAGVDAMAYFQDGETIPSAAERAGIYFISLHESRPGAVYELATIRVDWKKYYLSMLRQNLRKSVPETHWATILDRSVDITPVLSSLSPRERAYFETEYWEIRRGKIVFSGEIYDRNGVLRCSGGEAISHDSFPRMNWLARGVRVVGN